MADHAKHQKHANITRPNLGEYGRLEWAIIGTTCGEIQKLSRYLISSLSQSLNIAYVDADHASDDQKITDPLLDLGANVVYTDKIQFHQYHRPLPHNKFQRRVWYNEQDLILVNGNHFLANRQIVVIDPKKENSLQRKLDRLTRVDLILLKDGQNGPYEFLQKRLDEIHPEKRVPLLSFENQEAILNWFLEQYQAELPPLYGLVLAGGKSQRMGEDKANIDYHGIPQAQHVANLIAPYCAKTFISSRPGQTIEIGTSYEKLEDKLIGLGPFGAIATAFQHNPNKSWLVIACDLPLLTQKSVEQLIENRNPRKIATSFQSPVNEFPEPLITIWEPKSYPLLLQFLAQGYSCPRKVLINSDIECLRANVPIELTNVNHPNERDQIIRQLGK